MKRIPGHLLDVPSACAWAGCHREPDVQVEYAPGDDEGALEPALGWMPGTRAGRANLCNEHADQLRILIGAERIVGEMPIE